MDKILFSTRLSQKRKSLFKSQAFFAKEYIRRFPPKRADDSGGNEDNYNGILGTIKHYENPNYPGTPNLETVDNMCKILGCDVDYLLGTIDYETHDLKFVCEYTGLSAESVNELCNCRDYEKQTLSELIMSSRFHFLIIRLAWLVMSKNRLADALAAVTNLPSEDNHDELFDSLKYARLCAYEANNEWSRALEAYTECNSLIDKCSAIRRNTINGQP